VGDIGNGEQEDMMNKRIKEMLIIAFSAGYESGHYDTVEGVFVGDGRLETHREIAVDWVASAAFDGVFDNIRNAEVG
jgi:hypothetical protein